MTTSGGGDTPRLSTEDMIRDIHAWMAELMPFARVAVKMFSAKQKLMSRWVPGARRDD